MQKRFVHPITLDNWKNVPIFRGRLATMGDVDTGRAMFCTIKAEGKVCDKVDLPFCAIYTETKTGERFHIVAVQAEGAHDEIIVGAVKLKNGDTIVCTLSELEVVKDPDRTFFASAYRRPWWKFWQV